MTMTQQFLLAAVLVAVTLRGMRRYARARVSERETKVGGVMSLVAYFAVCGAVLLGIVGGFRILHMNEIESRWMAVDVSVSRCGVIRHDSPPGVDDYNYYGAECLFQPSDRQAAPIRWEACCTTESSVRAWLRGLPDGSRQRLYVHPDGRRVSLGWMEGPIAYQAPHRSAREMLVFACVGWLFWFWARWIERAPPAV